MKHMRGVQRPSSFDLAAALPQFLPQQQHALPGIHRASTGHASSSSSSNPTNRVMTNRGFEIHSKKIQFFHWQQYTS